MEVQRIARIQDKLLHAEDRLGLFHSWHDEARHELKDRLACYKAIQEAAESLADVGAMLLKSLGIPPHDDYSNYEALAKQSVLSPSAHDALVEFNGLRNALVHEYDGLSDDRALDAAQRSSPPDYQSDSGGTNMVDVERLKEAAGEIPGLGVLLWGSQATGDTHAASDVDLCIVVGPGVDPVDALRAAWKHFGDSRADVKLFEDLPVYLQGAVLESHKVLHAPDEPGLFEYLRPFWKRWADQSHRQQLSHSEAMAMLAVSG